MSSRMALALSADLSGDSQHALPPLGKLSADPAETFPLGCMAVEKRWGAGWGKKRSYFREAMKDKHC